ncbi:hypothetical protein BU15DRAFT_81150 [Melanogaster broomeanus]|nr:hypothetical protein BU15DRAFT_81150 [Melanogaster broomeanus]
MHSANLSRDTDTPSPPLQRGKACLSCRRRKMKCDGARPICTQCFRGDRAVDCEYTDGNRRPRTLVLEEEIARLSARVQELQNPQNVAPSVELYPPYTPLGTPSPSISRDHYQALGVTSSPTSRLVTSSVDTGLAFDGLPQQNVQNVQHSLTILTPHAAELGFFLNINRLRAHSSNIVPALHSMLTLWSIHISQQHLDLSEQDSEPALLSHAQHQLSDALSAASSAQDPQLFMQIIQTEVLLSFYLQRAGQPLGARYHASAALSLAVGLRLHLKSREATFANLFDFVGNSYPQLPPPTEAVEEDERVDAFWTVYSLDRCLGAIHNGPPAMNNGIMITVPWPSSHRSNEVTPLFPSTGSDRFLTSGFQRQSSFVTSTTNATSVNTVVQFLTGQDVNFSNDSPLARQAKASVLLSEAASIAASYTVDRAVSRSAAFQSRFTALDILIRRFSASISPPSISPGTQQPSTLRQTLLTINLTALAQITLHRSLASTHAPSDRRCIEAALRAAHALDDIGDPGLVSPVCAIIWIALCIVLHDEVLRLRAQRSQSSSAADKSWASSSRAPSRQSSHHEEETEICLAINKIFAVMSRLSAMYPSEV